MFPWKTQGPEQHTQLPRNMKTSWRLLSLWLRSQVCWDTVDSRSSGNDDHLDSGLGVIRRRYPAAGCVQESIGSAMGYNRLGEGLQMLSAEGTGASDGSVKTAGWRFISRLHAHHSRAQVRVRKRQRERMFAFLLYLAPVDGRAFKDAGCLRRRGWKTERFWRE